MVEHNSTSSKVVRIAVQSSTQGTSVEIGTAIIHENPSGDMMIDIRITNPDVASLLGGEEIRGLMPKHVVPLGEPLSPSITEE